MFTSKINKILSLVFLTSMLWGCAPPTKPQTQKTAAQHQAELASTQERKTTLGLFQSSIREGMSQADVAAAAGSPNIVSQDADGNETWIYDKISTETSHSKSSDTSAQESAVGVGVGGGVVGVVGSVLGGVLGGVSGSSVDAKKQSSSAGATSQSQKTLTVVIKFDEKRLVSSIRYQSSSF